MLGFLFSLLIAMNTSSFGGEVAEEHMTRNLVQSNYQKESPLVSSKIKDYPQNRYKLQYSKGNLLQVERVFLENEYGSTKETRIYMKDGKEYQLLSRHEWTETNLLTEDAD